MADGVNCSGVDISRLEQIYKRVATSRTNLKPISGAVTRILAVGSEILVQSVNIEYWYNRLQIVWKMATDTLKWKLSLCTVLILSISGPSE